MGYNILNENILPIRIGACNAFALLRFAGYNILPIRIGACEKMGHFNPCGHPTMNGIMKVEQPNPQPFSANNIISMDTTMSTITCKSCHNTVNGVLKTPHGMVCGNCFKLIYAIEPIKQEKVKQLVA